jgi:hypothetical protein
MQTGTLNAASVPPRTPDLASATASPGGRRSTVLLLIGAIVYSVLYCIFWPSIVTTMDESTMLNMSYVYRQGHWYADQAGVDIVFGWDNGSGHKMPQYPPAMSALLSVFSLGGWKMVFLSGLALHLGIFALVVAILRRLRLPDVLALLVLFYPTLVIYSRTLMTDLPSGLLIAAAFLFYLRRQPLLSGAMIGMSALLRTPNLAGAFFFGLGILIDSLLRRKSADAGAEDEYPGGGGLKAAFRDILLFALGFLPFFAFAWWYQADVQGGMWGKYGGQNLSLKFFPATFPTYLVSMMIVLPGLLLAPLYYVLRSQPGRFVLGALTYGFVFLYSCSFFTDSTASKVESLIIAQRYVQAVIPLFVVAYAAMLTGLTVRLSPKVRGLGTAAFVVGLALIAAGIHYKHENYLKNMVNMRSLTLEATRPDDVLLVNAHVAKLFSPGPYQRRYTVIMPGEEKLEPFRIKAIEKIDGLLASPTGKRIAVANWSRDYRAETRNEQDMLKALRSRYEVKDAPLASRPEGFDLFYITGKKAAAPASSAR